MQPLRITEPTCSQCGLNGNRKVDSHGPTTPGGLMVIGEAPGGEDVAKNVPFVGYSGQLLRRLLSACGFDPDQTYYTNTNLCRPPGSRSPSEHEIWCCSKRLESEILAKQPDKILLVGTTPTQALLKENVLKVFGKYYEWNGIPVMPAPHPAFVLRTPEIFRDLAFCIQKLRRAPRKNFTIEADGLPSYPYKVLEYQEDAWDLLVRLQHTTPVRMFVDIETESPDPYTANLLSVGFKMEWDNMVYIIPADVFHIVKDEFYRLCHLNNPVGQNASFEWKWFKHMHGVDIRFTSDTMLKHYVADERSGDDDSGGRGFSYHGLKVLGRLYEDLPDWSAPMRPYHENFGLAPKEILYRYQALDIAVLQGIDDQLSEQLINESTNLFNPLNEVLIPATSVIGTIELNGMKVDPEYFSQLNSTWEKEIQGDLVVLREVIGKPTFNINSPKQVAELLFDDLKLPMLDGRSTNSKTVLKKLRQKFPNQTVLKSIADIRSKKHIQATYVIGIPKLINPMTHRVHTSVLLHGTDTGRLASRHPNLQNIPSRIGTIIRDGFIAEDGWELGNADYKQLEFRVLAYYSLDKTLIDFIKTGRSIHKEMARMYFHLGENDEITKSMLLDAKAVVFGVIYQRTAQSIAEEFDITLEEAKRRVALLYQVFPNSREWMVRTQEFAIKHGYVESAMGRKRRFPLITKENIEEVKRQAVNSPLQSFASDICLNSAKRFLDLDLDPNKIRLLMSVHDSLVFEWRPEYRDEFAPIIKEIMELDKYDSPVPWEIELEYGPRWGEESLTKYEFAQ